MINKNLLKLFRINPRNLIRFIQMLALLLCSVSFSQTAWAVIPSFYDSRFGTNGFAVSPILGDVDGKAIAITPDGKAVIVGVSGSSPVRNFAVTRYTVYGVPDATFSSDGAAVYELGGDDVAQAVAVQPDGKIIIGGYSKVGLKANFILLRVTADGNFDTSFGNNGTIQTTIGNGDDKINSIVLQPDGKIVVAGSSTTNGSIHFAVAHYNTNGELDATFSGDGKIVTTVGAVDIANTVALQADGKIVIAGKSLMSGNYDFSLVRYTADGILDPGFQVTTPIRLNNDEIRAMAIQEDGKIVVAGNSEEANSTSDVALARYNTNGTLDSSFDSDGKVITEVGFDNLANGIALQKNGKILVAGINIPSGSKSELHIVRYLSNGSTDPKFGTDGISTYAPMSEADNSASAIAIQPNGRIVIAGTGDGDSGKKQFAMRFQGNPPPAADFDGDYKSDYSVFRPSNGTWYSLNSKDNQVTTTQFGMAGDIITPGDFDADGKTDVAVFRPSTGVWYRLNSRDNSFYAYQFGLNGDMPMPADYDGDGFTDIAVYRPTGNLWYVLRSKTGVINIKQFGTAGDIPVRGDFDGNGNDNVAVFRPSTGVWYYSNAGDNTMVTIQFGLAGDIPAPADFESVNYTQIAVFRPSTGVWYIKTGIQSVVAAPFGANGDRPIPGDYDRDGKADMAVWRPSSGIHYVLQSSNNQFKAIQWGLDGDVPVAGF